MFEAIHRQDGKVYRIYNVTDKGEGEIYFLIFKNDYFTNEQAFNFIPKP
jgi:hypothetical protein